MPSIDHLPLGSRTLETGGVRVPCLNLNVGPSSTPCCVAAKPYLEHTRRGERSPPRNNIHCSIIEDLADHILDTVPQEKPHRRLALKAGFLRDSSANLF